MKTLHQQTPMRRGLILPVEIQQSLTNSRLVLPAGLTIGEAIPLLIAGLRQDGFTVYHADGNLWCTVLHRKRDYDVDFYALLTASRPSA